MTSTCRAIARLPLARVFAITLTIMSAPLAAQPAPYDSAKPLSRATLFAPGTISTGDYDSHVTFTPDGREIYFLKLSPNFSRWSIFVSRENRQRNRCDADYDDCTPALFLGHSA